MKVRTSLFATLAIAICLLAASSVRAQVGGSGAQLNGTVRDESGGTVAKAAVALRDSDTNRSYSTTTNDRGYYVLANLTPGRYELKVSFTGFSNYVQTGLVLTVGQTATVDIDLKVATKGEQVVVTGETQIIEPTKTEISQVIETQQIDSLPISARQFTDFALLTPGVATSRTSLGTTFTEYEATQISFGGMRSFSNEITVDGADFVNAASGVQRSTPPQEAVQEFRVVNNSFGAEYGRALGGIVNIVTKSGSNDLHGSAYEYFQNSGTDARSLLQPAPLPHDLNQNQFGGTLGGPVQKDKTFFFMNYEGRRRSESPLYPPDLVNNLSVIDESKALMGLAPEGCFGGLAACGGPGISSADAFGFLTKFHKTQNNDYGFARLDHQINGNNRLGIRYNIEDARDQGELVGQTLDGGGIGTPSGGRNLFVRDQSAFVNLDTSIRPNLVNTVLVQYARRHYNFPGATGEPDFSILNDLELGHNFGTNDRLYETRVQFADSIAWVKGNHVAKFGFDGNKIWSLINFPGFTPVRMLVPGISCVANFAEFYNANFGANVTPPADVDAAAATCAVPQDNGVVFAYAGIPLSTDPTFTAGPPLVTTANPLDTTTWANAFPPGLFNGYGHEIDHSYWGLYAQDQWRLTSKLTLNFGLRWDYESGLAAYVDPDHKGFQPRVGFAYSPNSKTVIRAGFGMFDDRYNLTFFFVPNTQKVVPGYQCGFNAPSSIAAACAAGGVQPQTMPMITSVQASQIYQLFAFPGVAGAAEMAADIISTGAYNVFPPTSFISIAGTCDTTFACGVGSGGMDHKLSRIPYAEQASLEVDRQIGRGLSINVGYLFVAAHRLVRGNNINVPCPVGTTDSAQAANPTDPGDWPLAPPGFPFPHPDWVPGKLNANGTFSGCNDGTPTLGTGALAGLGPWFAGAGIASGLQTMSAGLEDYNNGVANAVYHGGTLTVIERIKNFNMTANYTYSHTLDNGNFTTFINLPVNQFDYKAERANSNQDARHHFVANFTGTGPEHSFIRHFVLSGILTLQSGRPFTIFYGNNTFNDVAGGATDRVGGAPVVGACPTPTNCSTVIPRNTYIGDQLYSLDMHLSRYFQLTERLKLDLGVDAFNLLNRPNVDEVTSVYGSPVFCGSPAAIPQHYRDATSRAIESGSGSTACPVGDVGLVPGGSLASTPIFLGSPLFIPTNPNSTFGLPRTMLNPRQLQFSAKFTF